MDSTHGPGSEAALRAFAERAAAFAGIRIPEDCWPGVLANLRTLGEHAALVMDWPLDPEVQIDPGFRP